MTAHSLSQAIASMQLSTAQANDEHSTSSSVDESASPPTPTRSRKRRNARLSNAMATSASYASIAITDDESSENDDDSQGAQQQQQQQQCVEPRCGMFCPPLKRPRTHRHISAEAEQLRQIPSGFVTPANAIPHPHLCSTPRRTKKSVRFAPLVTCHLIPSRHHYHPAILADIYRSQHDNEQTKRRIMQTLKLLSAAKCKEIEGKASIRGLERFVPNNARRIEHSITQSITTVLHLQSKHRFYGVRGHYIQFPSMEADIASAYHQTIKSSARLAYRRGVMDAKAAWR